MADETLLFNAIESGCPDQALELLNGDNHFSQAALDRSLLMACLHGHKYLVQTLVRLGANVQCRDINGNTPLMICADKGFTDIVRFLLSRKANVNDVNSAGDTALILSIHSLGSVELLKVLLQQKRININHQNQNGYTALMKAVEVKDIHAMKILLEKPYDEKYKKQYVYCYDLDFVFRLINTKGQTVQDIAETSGLANMFRILKESIYSRMRVPPLALAAEECDTESFNNLLDCLILDTDDMERSVRVAFITIFENCQLKMFNDNEILMIDRLVKCGADVNICLHKGHPLCTAVEAGNYNLVELLCKHGAKLNQYRYRSASDPLQTAAKTGRFDLVELMLSYKADITRKSLSGFALECTPSHGHIECVTLDIKYALISAVDHQLPEYMKFLLDNYKPEVFNHFLDKTENGPDLLISAVKGGNVELIGQILDAGVDINQPIETGVTPLVATKTGEVAQFLIQRGADVNQIIDIKTCGRITPVIYVLLAGFNYDTPTVELVRVLLDNGASVNGRDATEKTAIMMAAEKEGSVDMLQVLLRHGADLCDKDKKW